MVPHSKDDAGGERGKVRAQEDETCGRSAPWQERALPKGMNMQLAAQNATERYNTSTGAADTHPPPSHPRMSSQCISLYLKKISNNLIPMYPNSSNLSSSALGRILRGGSARDGELELGKELLQLERDTSGIALTYLSPCSSSTFAALVLQEESAEP